MMLVETFNPESVKAFLRGSGIVRRCMGGFDKSETVENLMSHKDNHFLLAFDGEIGVGFVCLFKVDQAAYTIHLCLRTIGNKTKEVVKMCIGFASHFLEAKVLYAIYPKSARAVTALARHFKFRPDDKLAGDSHVIFPEPYAFERLDLI